MTAPNRSIVRIPAPLAPQREVLDHRARFKAWRAGRRLGKTRGELIGCVRGHGPRDDATGRRLWKGLVDGAQLAWVSPDYPQSRAIWEEEIKPRFQGAVGVKINDSERTLRVGKGKLELRSAEAIDGLRGKKLDGVVVDEAAFIRGFMYAWQRVIRPTLIDLGGWAIIGSTTHIGSDFNRLIAEVEAGERGEDWHSWCHKTRDNPRLAPEEVEAIYAEYPPGSTDAEQELEAALLEAHGDLFKEEYFHWYRNADRSGMWLPNGDEAPTFVPFVEVVLYADLASSMKQTADFTSLTLAGLTAKEPDGGRQAGVLANVNEKLEGPDQLDLLERAVKKWKPTRVKIEATQYQATSVQHMKRRCPNTRFEAVYPDKDKRTRAIPWAAAMARGDVWWPQRAAWVRLAVKQHLKFPHGKEGSVHADDHDDIVDTGSMCAVDLLRSTSPWITRTVVV